MSIAAFPGLTATAVVDDNGFSSLNYRSARRFREPSLEAVSRETDGMLAESKLDNPALAIVAAHICYRLGELEQIYDMENYPIGRGAYTPCDFLLLTGRKWAADYHRRVGTRRCLFWTDSNDFRLSLQSSEAL
jgi:hypothetical protein